MSCLNRGLAAMPDFFPGSGLSFVDSSEEVVYLREFCILDIPCPGKLGANLSNIDVCGTNMRDHDFGKDIKNGKHSIFPYMNPDQLV